jgi:hypothetical protein
MSSFSSSRSECNPAITRLKVGHLDLDGITLVAAKTAAAPTA